MNDEKLNMSEAEKILNENQIKEWGTTLLTSKIPGAQNIVGEWYALSFMVPYPKFIIEEIKANGPTHLYFHHYRTINTHLDNTALKIALSFQNEGYDAFYVPASQSQSADGFGGFLSHKAVACLAGIGGVGQNALFLSKQYGPCVRLSTVLTKKVLKNDAKPKEICLNCNKCVHACPSGALYGINNAKITDERVDVRKCSMHMKKEYKHVGRGAVCGICMAVCPLYER